MIIKYFKIIKYLKQLTDITIKQLEEKINAVAQVFLNYAKANKVKGYREKMLY